MLRSNKFMYSMCQKIKSIIKHQYQPILIDIQDDSHLHSKGKETHFRLYVVSDKFEDVSYIDRHKKIMKDLKENNVMQKIHAISIVPRTQEEHDNSLGGNFKPNCQGGHQQLNKKLQMNQKPKLTSDKYFDQVPDLKIISKEITLKDVKNRKLKKEFQLVKAITSTEDHYKKILKKYKNKNRYVDVVAFGHNIVTTDKKPLDSTNYIHANYLQFEKDQKIILTQGPLEQTTEDFWKMVEVHKTRIIVGIVEYNQVPNKCNIYWTDKKTQFGKYVIELESKERKKIYVQRTIKVTNNETGKQFEVMHYHLDQWIDKTAISSDQYPDLIELLEKFYFEASNYTNNNPVLHCSAGIGRTGVFSSCLMLYSQFKKCKRENKEFKFSVFETVRYIRESRFGTIETQPQYDLLYDIVFHFKQFIF